MRLVANVGNRLSSARTVDVQQEAESKVFGAVGILLHRAHVHADRTLHGKPGSVVVTATRPKLVGLASMMAALMSLSRPKILPGKSAAQRTNYLWTALFLIRKTDSFHYALMNCRILRRMGLWTRLACS